MTISVISGYGQGTLEGFVRAEENGEPIPQVYVVNLTTEEDVVTNSNGYFSIEVTSGDTLLLSHISYSFKNFPVPEFDEDEQWVSVIDMEPRSYLLDEVEVDAYRLTTNKPRAMELEEPNVPRNEDIVYPATSEQPGISSPVDLLYWYFGNRPRQLRELQRLKEEDAYREKLEEGNNREILIEITGLSPEELEAFVWSCKYAGDPISTMNDYDLLISLLQCYDEYVELQEENDVLNDAEDGW